MQKSKTGKFSIFNSLDVKLKFLMSRVELTQFSVESSHVKLKIWATWLKLSWKCKQLNLISIWVQNVNLKLDLMISLLIKKRHYVLCHWKDNDISVEEMIWIMLWNVYQLYDLSNSIVSNRDSQFISTMWQSLCKWLRITASLLTIYHFEINN